LYSLIWYAILCDTGPHPAPQYFEVEAIWTLKLYRAQASLIHNSSTGPLPWIFDLISRLLLVPTSHYDFNFLHIFV
jgi:hypothetical protein